MTRCKRPGAGQRSQDVRFKLLCRGAGGCGARGGDRAVPAHSRLMAAGKLGVVGECRTAPRRRKKWARARAWVRGRAQAAPGSGPRGERPRVLREARGRTGTLTWRDRSHLRAGPAGGLGRRGETVSGAVRAYDLAPGGGAVQGCRVVGHGTANAVSRSGSIGSASAATAGPGPATAGPGPAVVSTAAGPGPSSPSGGGHPRAGRIRNSGGPSPRG